MNRRALLLSAGGLAGALGLGGYHQRRRLQRWDDRNALRTARDRDRPTPPASTMLTVTDDHLESAASDLEDLLDDARAVWPAFDDGTDDLPREVERTQSTLESAEADRSAAEDRLENLAALTPAERLALLDDLRSALRRAGRALAFAQVLDDDRDADAVADALDAVAAAYDTVSESLEYRADDLPWAVAAYGELDARLEDVRVAIVAGRRALERDRSGRVSDTDGEDVDWLAVDELALASMRAFAARARLEDVERFEAHLHDDADASVDAADALERTYESLRDRVETLVDSVDFGYGDDHSAYAREVWVPYLFDRSGGGDERREGRVALATRLAAERYAVALTLADFADVPSPRFPDDGHPLRSSFETTGEDVLEAATRADEALERCFDSNGAGRADGRGGGAHSANPLAHHLCTVLADDRDRRDRQLERTLADINDVDDEEWTLALEDLRLGYRRIEAVTSELSTVRETIADG